jgi:hypothetical protein
MRFTQFFYVFANLLPLRLAEVTIPAAVSGTSLLEKKKKKKNRSDGTEDRTSGGHTVG